MLQGVFHQNDIALPKSWGTCKRQCYQVPALDWDCVNGPFESAAMLGEAGLQHSGALG